MKSITKMTAKFIQKALKLQDTIFVLLTPKGIPWPRGESLRLTLTEGGAIIQDYNPKLATGQITGNYEGVFWGKNLAEFLEDVTEDGFIIEVVNKSEVSL